MAWPRRRSRRRRTRRPHLPWASSTKLRLVAFSRSFFWIFCSSGLRPTARFQHRRLHRSPRVRHSRWRVRWNPTALERTLPLMQPWIAATTGLRGQMTPAVIRAPEQRVTWVVREEEPSAGILAWLVPEDQAERGRGATLDLLSAWLSGAPDSPLQVFRQGRPQRVADAFVWRLGPSDVFGVYFETTPGLAPQVVQVLRDALQLVATGGMTDADLERARQWIEAAEELVPETAMGTASRLARAQAAGDLPTAWRSASDLERLTRADLQQAAATLRAESMLAVGRGSAEEARILALGAPVVPPPVPTDGSGPPSRPALIATPGRL